MTKVVICHFYCVLTVVFFQIQFVESLNNEIVYSSPLIGTLFDDANSDVIFDINNVDANSPIVIDKMVLPLVRSITGLNVVLWG